MLIAVLILICSISLILSSIIIIGTVIASEKRIFKILICLHIFVETIGLLLVNEHKNGLIVNNVLCKIQGAFIDGAELSLAVAYILLDNRFNIYGPITYLSMIIPFYLDQLGPGTLMCGQIGALKQIKWSIISISTFIVLFRIRLINNYMTYYFIIYAITNIINGVLQNLSQFEDILLILTLIRNLSLQFLYIIEGRQDFINCCSLEKKKKQIKKKKIQVNFEEKEDDKDSVYSRIPSDSSSQDSGFPFAKTIQNLLYVYGDRKKSELHDLAHLMLQELLSQIFHPKILYALLQKQRNPWSDDEMDEKFVYPYSDTKNKKILLNYLFAVFKEFVVPYQRLSKNLTKVQKKIQTNDYEQALQKKSEQENILFEEDVFDQSDLSQEIEGQEESPQPEWEKYMKARIESMNRREFVKFMEMRSKTFLTNKQFKKFADPHEFGVQFQESLNLKFLNYCLCKLIKKILQRIIKGGKQVIEEADLKKQGYELIQKYILRAKKYALQDRKLAKMAYNLFMREFKVEGYEAFFSLKIKLSKNAVITESQVNPQEEWRKMGVLRQRWIDRVKAEKQLKQKFIKKKDIVPNNQYTQYLLDKIGDQKYENAKEMFPTYFKSYFINFKCDKPINSIYD
ncbi:hypothetical protein pb186bvf_001419 [Paramecium bursaria]